MGLESSVTRDVVDASRDVLGAALADTHSEGV
jgi:hypothetical protein